MKKLFISLALLIAGMGSAAAQQMGGPKPGSWKASEKINKADALMYQHTPESMAEALNVYTEAEGILKADMDKAKEGQKNDKLALLYYQNAQLQYKMLSPELEKAQQNVPFDTLNFCKRVDGTLASYAAAQEYNVKPNAKGKVKIDKTLQSAIKMGAMALTDFYYYCGAFMDAVGNKQESVNYFQKFVDFPQTKIFEAADRDSIYARAGKTYSQARVNLALQNFHLKNWDQAIACCDEALKDTIGVHDLYIIKINALGEKKDSVAWQNTLVEAAKRTGETTFIQNLLYSYMQNKKVDDALAFGTKLVTEDPNNKINWYVKGALELNIASNYEEARKSLEKALAIDPNYEDALFNMGTAYINDIYEQRLEGKFKFIGMDQVVQGNGKAVSAKDKALCQEQIATVKSYYEKAKPYLEKLRQLTPNDARRWASPLQIVYSSLNEMDKAQEMDALLDAANKSAL